MNNLVFTKTLDSRYVAQLLKKEHYDLLKDIERYKEYFREVKIPFSEFFTESSYKTNGNNKSYKNYQITKKGCDFLAHKLTGQKGAIFTALYIEEFEKLEQNTTTKLADPNIIGMLIQTQQTMMSMLLDMQNKVEQKQIENTPIIEQQEIQIPQTKTKKITKQEKLAKLLKRQSLPKTLKILKLPSKIIDMIDLMLSAEHINYSYISRILSEKGYKISYKSITNYHKALRGIN